MGINNTEVPGAKQPVAEEGLRALVKANNLTSLHQPNVKKREGKGNVCAIYGTYMYLIMSMTKLMPYTTAVHTRIATGLL